MRCLRSDPNYKRGFDVSDDNEEKVHAVDDRLRGRSEQMKQLECDRKRP